MGVSYPIYSVLKGLNFVFKTFDLGLREYMKDGKCTWFNAISGMTWANAISGIAIWHDNLGNHTPPFTAKGKVGLSRL